MAFNEEREDEKRLNQELSLVKDTVNILSRIDGSEKAFELFVLLEEAHF